MSLVSIFTLASYTAQAWDVTAKVITIEPSYIPDMVLFKIDAAAGTCPAENWIYYYGTAYTPTEQKRNMQSMYAGLLTSTVSGKRMEVHGDVHCTAINIHPTNQ